jgi:hypothetical protein
MKSIIFRPTVLATVCAIAIASGIVATRAHADEWDQRTILTVNQPIQVRQVVLDPGTYVMKLYNSSAKRDIVQIYTADERQLIDTVQATPAYRPRPANDTAFTYWETPTGTVRALRTWFYPGQLIGQAFPKPDHPKELASTTESSTQALNTPPAAPETPAQPQGSAQSSEPNSQTDQAAEANANSQADRSADVAENSAPPEPAAEPAPAPEPQSMPAAAPEPQDTATPDKPAQMPKTASPFPLIGLSGALMFGLGGLLRVIRLS